MNFSLVADFPSSYTSVTNISNSLLANRLAEEASVRQREDEARGPAGRTATRRRMDDELRRTREDGALGASAGETTGNAAVWVDVGRRGGEEIMKEKDNMQTHTRTTSKGIVLVSPGGSGFEALSIVSKS